jgi:hypothetical protein
LWDIDLYRVEIHGFLLFSDRVLGSGFGVISSGMAKRKKPVAFTAEFQGLPLRIEYSPGDKRYYGEDQFVVMSAHYGEVRGTKGTDGDPVDVYVGPSSDSSRVFVIKQMKVGDFEKFDEEKCVLGTKSAEEAKALYLAHYSDPKFFGGIREINMSEFKKRLETKGQVGEKLAAAVRRAAELNYYKLASGQPLIREPLKVASPAALEALRAAVRQKTAELSERGHRIADRIDNVGLGVLAAPYAAKGVANMLEHRGGRLGAIGKGARALAGEHGFLHRHENKLELAGLEDMTEPEKEQYLGILTSFGKTASVAKSVVGAGKLLATLGAAGATVGAYKGVKNVAEFVGQPHEHPTAPPQYIGPRLF